MFVLEAEMSFSSDQPFVSNQLPISIDYPKPDTPEFLNVLSLDRKRISDAVNTKEGALYLLDEIASFKQYFTQGNPQQNRNAYRKTFDLVNLNGGNIGAGATVTTPHNISGISSAVLIYASCTTITSEFFTVVYPDIFLDATNINFTNPSAAILTQCYVVAEYLKN